MTYSGKVEGSTDGHDNPVGSFPLLPAASGDSDKENDRVEPPVKDYQLQAESETPLLDLGSQASQEGRNDSFDSTLTLQRLISPFKSKGRSTRSPLKKELLEYTGEVNQEDDFGRLIASPFVCDDLPLSNSMEYEEVDEAIKKYAEENEMSLDIDFRCWAQRGIENARHHITLTEKLVASRYLLFKHFKQLDDCIVEYARSLEGAKAATHDTVDELRIMGNDLVNRLT